MSNSAAGHLINGTVEGVSKLFHNFVAASGSTQGALLVGTCGTLAAVSTVSAFSKVILTRDGAAVGKKISQYQKPAVDFYDVAIVGAGPSGSSLSFYLCRDPSWSDKRVLLLEKKKFPREKYCGDAVCTMAQKHLKEMGVLQEIVEEKKGLFAQSGGFVSPNGNSFIGNSAVELNLGTGGAAISIKRIVMDEKVAKAAKKSGALLTENTTVETATFDAKIGLWKVECTQTTEDSEDAKPITYYARVLVCADGAPSGLATKLGLVTTAPQGTCSRAYVKDNKLFQWDGVVFYPPQLLPGYCAIFREAGDELNFCTYIIPGGPAKNEDLASLHDDIMKNDPYVSKCLGPNPNIERMKSASLRLGGERNTYGDHLLVIGDAAGFIDPLTGEGIQYALESGMIAADTLREAFKKGDVSHAAMRRYQRRWNREWGLEFWMSMKMSLFLFRFPILLDATANLIKKKGSNFMAEWAEVMTGTKSKTWFIRLDVWPYLVIEIVAQAWRNAFPGAKPTSS